MNFTKNIHFTRLVKAADRLREFNFKKLAGTPEQFHVDVSDDRGNRIVFRMRKEEDNHWKIQEQGLPNWLSNTEDSLNDAIEHELHD